MVITQQGNIVFKTILFLLIGILFFTSVSAKTEELATKYNIQMLGWHFVFYICLCQNGRTGYQI